MPISDFATYKSKIITPSQRIQDTKTSTTSVAGRLVSMWRTSPFGADVPGAADTCSSSTTGALGQLNGSTTQRIAQISVSLQQSAYIIVADRLVESGGLSGTVTTPQSVDTPSLTRYTNGVGVVPFLEIYTTVGTTGTIATVSYTNQSGTSGRIGYAGIGGTGFNAAQRSLVINLQAGDSGVRSVESVTLAGSTGTVGNFGVTLAKPLYFMPVPNLGSQQFLFDSVMTCCGNMPVIQNNACLYYLASTFTNSTGVYQSAIRFIEDE